MAELQILSTNKLAVTRSVGTTALGSNVARIVVETTYSSFQIAQALRKLNADLHAAFRATGGGHVFSAVAFADNARFADGSSFADQNTLGL